MRGSVMAAAAAAVVWATAALGQEGSTTSVRTGETTTTTSEQAPALGSETVSTRSETVEETRTESGHWLKGAFILVGAGVEGYTGSLASRIGPGPAWNVIFGIQPSSVFGLEFAYQGALNSVKFSNFGLSTKGGADIVRTAGQANVTFAFGPWKVQPFVLAGLGINHDSVSDNARSVGFSSDTNGYIPVGGGVRGQIEGVMVDLRGSWQLPFSDNLFPGNTGENTLGLATGHFGRWNATLNVGGTW
jgi:hypothetical protein